MQSATLPQAEVRRFALLVIATENEPLIGSLARLCRASQKATALRTIAGSSRRDLFQTHQELQYHLSLYVRQRTDGNTSPTDPLARIHIPEELQLFGNMSVTSERLLNALLRNQSMFRDVADAVPEDGPQQCASANLRDEARVLVQRLTSALTHKHATERSRSLESRIPPQMLQRLQSRQADATPPPYPA